MIEAEYEELHEEEGELDLADTDNLPWLESDADEEETGGLDLTQIVSFAAGLLLLGAVVVGGVWYLSNRAGETAMVADGSVIAAPEGPIKERPQDPGGKEFAGTGNVAPVVGEGGTREAVVAAAPTVPAAPAISVAAPTPAPSAAPAASAAAAPDTSGVAVQLAAYGSRARAEQGWSDLSRRTATLSGVRHRVVEGRVDIGTVYRLQAVVATRPEAEQLCAALKADGLDCQVK